MFFYSEPDGQNEIAGSTDPYFNNVSLLLSLDSNFNDSSLNNHSVTVNGNTTISSTESKFGGGSGYFGGTDYLRIPATPSLHIGLQDFTLEMWVNRNGSSTSKFYIFNIGGHGSNSYALYIQDGYLRSDFYTNTSISANIDTVPGVWSHIATSRENGVLRTFVDGVLVSTNSGAAVSVSNSDITIGGLIWDQYYDFVGGYIDDLRLTIGVARYTANFTPPDSLPTS